MAQKLYETQKLSIYNSFDGKKEIFKPVNDGIVTMYVCGPTVYSYVHLGNCRTFISFDLMFRYLRHLGYKVRYVRNITDVGHLENDADSGEDKIAKKAKIEKLEPMEIVQEYTTYFHSILEKFNCLVPSIEPTATGHIIEQQQIIEDLIEKGWAYVSNGSVYFDVEKYNRSHPVGENSYGQLSGRNIDELISGTRELDSQSEKHSPRDFALWKKASPFHIMRWKSPWSEGFPGWHLECSAMSSKYLGETFDIHGGGMDLKFPHHECEIAQNTAHSNSRGAKYWIHANMLTLNGKRMSKSTGNTLNPHELFSGENNILDRAFEPAVVRFFIMQAHYGSVLDFSSEALKAAEKGFLKLWEAISKLDKISPSKESSFDYKLWQQSCYDALNDDFNTPIVIAKIFEAVSEINKIYENKASISQEDLNLLKQSLKNFVEDIMGIEPIKKSENTKTLENLVRIFIEQRNAAKKDKNYALADSIRNELQNIGVFLKDNKDGSSDFTIED